MRITQKDLERLVNELNERFNPEDNLIGRYTLSYAYGGVKLDRITSKGYSVEAVSEDGFDTKRKLYTFMRGMIKGIWTADKGNK